jgi:hypothetical protein
VSLDRQLEHLEFGRRFRVAREQPGGLQSVPVFPCSGSSSPVQRNAARAFTESMESKELLKPVHADLPHPDSITLPSHYVY